MKIGFIVIVVVRLCLTHSNICSFTKNIIRRAPMVTIRRHSGCGSGGTDTTAFIQFDNGRKPQINKLWCLGLDGIFLKVHPTAGVEVPAGTIREFVTNYLDENGFQIMIIGQISVKGSVIFLGLSDQAWGSEFLYIANLLAQSDVTERAVPIIPIRTG